MASTLSERFRRAIISDDLATAKAVAKRAFSETGHDSQPFDIRNQTALRSRHNQSSLLLTSSENRYSTTPASSSSDSGNGFGTGTDGMGVAASSSKVLLEMHSSTEPALLIGPCDFLPALSAGQHQLAQQHLHRDRHRHSGQCKSSLTLAIETNASIELVQWLLDTGHERYSYSRDARNCTMVSLAAQHNRTDIIDALCTEAVANAASMHHERALALARAKSVCTDQHRYYEGDSSFNDDSWDDTLVRRGHSHRISDDGDAQQRKGQRSSHSTSRDEQEGSQRKQGLPKTPPQSKSSSGTDTGGGMMSSQKDKEGTTAGADDEGEEEYDDNDDEKAISREMSQLIDSQDDLGRTALSLASMKGYQEIVSQLIEVGANFDLTDFEGNTPLHYAAAYNHILVVQLLIEKGCSFASKNKLGFTAADYAYTTNLKGALEAFARAKFDRGRKDQDSASPVLYRLKNTVVNPAKSMQAAAQHRLATQLRDLHF